MRIREHPFVSVTTLTESEKIFYEKVLKRGEKEGYWLIDKYLIYGRAGLGIDFLIYGKGGAIWIEFKKSSSFAFTNIQKKRFKSVNDHERAVNRFCGIIDDPYTKKNKIVAYWTPNLWRNLPDENFSHTSFKGVDYWTVNFFGLEKYLSKYSFTQLKSKYNGNLLLSLLQTPNATIYQMESGILGKGIYRAIDEESAFDVFYEKLKYTSVNLTEDLDRAYMKCQPYTPPNYMLRQVIEEKMYYYIFNSYRPLFISDFLQRLSADPEISTKLPLLRIDLSTVVRNILRREVNAERIAVFDIPTTRKHSYGMPNRKYLLYTYQTSEFLDTLRTFFVNTGFDCANISQLARIANAPEVTIRTQLSRGQEELYREGAIELTKYHPIEICLTERGIQYITRTGEFAL